jgi:hypothetical protein
MKSLEVTQRTAAKLLTFSKIGVNSGLIFKNLKWMSLKESIDYFSSVYIFKAINGRTSENSKDFFVRNESQQRTRSRVREELKIPSFKRQYMQNSIFYKSVKYYNSLPLELRTASDLKTFYKNLKTHFNIVCYFVVQF